MAKGPLIGCILWRVVYAKIYDTEVNLVGSVSAGTNNW